MMASTHYKKVGTESRGQIKVKGLSKLDYPTLLETVHNKLVSW